MSFVNQFFISDTHFSHQLMVLNRPFSTIDEMDRFMIDAWNSVVRDTDIVWHLGDFSFADEKRTKVIFDQLNGRKRLILGNHDIHHDGSLRKSISQLAWDRPPVQMADIRVDGERVILCHYAMLAWPAQHRGSFHFYGHSHGKLTAPGRARDVGVDVPDVAFTPRTFAELRFGMEVTDD